MSIFRGASVNVELPLNPFFALKANDLSLSQSAVVSTWGNFTQSTSTFQPSFNIDATTNLKSVSFTGTSTTRMFLQWNTNQTLAYGTGGGSSIVLFARYKTALVQFNRTLSHTGPTGNARTFEYIIGESGTSGMHPKYFYANSTAALLPPASVPLNKWTLYITVFTNSTNTAQIYVNTNTTPVATRTALTALQDSVLSTLYVGAQGTTGRGQDVDIHFAALYPRPLNSSELANVRAIFSSSIQP